MQQASAAPPSLRADNVGRNHRPVGVTVFVDGEEEIGLPTLGPLLEQHQSHFSGAMRLIAPPSTRKCTKRSQEFERNHASATTNAVRSRGSHYVAAPGSRQQLTKKRKAALTY